MTEKSKKVPPYLSLSRLQRVLEILKTRSLKNAPVTASFFQNYEFSIGDASLAVNFLRFIGAIDDGGIPTPVMDNLRLESEEKRREAFASIVRTAYADLYEAIKDPHTLSRDALKDEFRVQYQQSPRITDSAIPVFLKLAEYGGLVESGATVIRTQKPRAKKATSGLPSPTLKIGQHGVPIHDQGMHIQPILKNRMTITIPEDVFIRASIDDEVNASWRAVLKAAHAFATTYVDKKENPGGTG